MLRQILCSAFIVGFGSSLAAQQTERLYQDARWQCEGSKKVWQTYWRVEDLGSQTRIVLAIGQLGRDDTALFQWDMQGAPTEPVQIESRARFGVPRTTYMVSGLGTDTLTAQTNHENCPVMEAVEVSPAIDQYRAAIDRLRAPAPQLREAAELTSLRTNALPPAEFLPTLDQQNLVNEIAQAERTYLDALKEQIAGIGEDAEVASGPDGISALIAFWNNQGDPRTNWSDEVLNAIAKSTVSYHTAGLPKTTNLPQSADELCARMSGLRRLRYDSLQIVMGLPDFFWDREIAQKALDFARSCPDDPGMEGAITNLWPRYEQTAATFGSVLNEIDRMQSVEASLEGLAEANWMRVNDRELRRLRYNRAVISTLVDSKLETLAAKTAPIVADDLVSNSETDVADHQLGDLVSFCEMKLREFRAPNNAPVIKAIVDECDSRLIERFGDRAKALVETQKTQIQQAEPSLESYGQSKAYWITLNAINYSPNKESFRPIFDSVRQLVQQENAALSEQRSMLIETTQQELQTNFDALDPLDRDSRGEAKKLCRGWSDPLPSSDDLVQLCRKKAQDFVDVSNSAICANIWEEADFPEEFQGATFPAPEGIDDTITVREFVCEGQKHNADILPVRDRGFLSSSYLLVRNEEMSGQSITFSVEIELNDAEDAIVFTEAKLEPDNWRDGLSFAEDPIEVAARCLFDPKYCVGK